MRVRIRLGLVLLLFLIGRNAQAQIGFFPPQVIPPPDPDNFTYYTWIRSGDLNGDGRDDLVMGASDVHGPSLHVRLANADGTFGAAIATPVPLYPMSSYARPVIADVNADGRLDIIFASDQSDGGGGVTSALVVVTGTGRADLGAPVVIEGGADTTGFAAADFDGDHNIDLLVGTASGNVRLFRNQGRGVFGAAVDVTPAGVVPMRGMAAGDINGDGTMDFVACGYFFREHSVALGNGDGTFVGIPTLFHNPIECRDLNLADLNGDGRLDLVTVDDFSRLRSGMNVGDGTFSIAETLAVESITDLATADLDRNGVMDVLFFDPTAALVNTSIGGDNRFKPIHPTGAVSSAWIAVGDFNGDGRLDLGTINQSDADPIYSLYVLIQRQPPIVNAGPDQHYFTNTFGVAIASLLGSASIPGGGELTYEWLFDQQLIVGTSLALNNITIGPGVHELTLTARHASGAEGSDTALVSIEFPFGIPGPKGDKGDKGDPGVGAFTGSVIMLMPGSPAPPGFEFLGTFKLTPGDKNLRGPLTVDVYRKQ